LTAKGKIDNIKNQYCAAMIAIFRPRSTLKNLLFKAAEKKRKTEPMDAKEALEKIKAAERKGEADVAQAKQHAIEIIEKTKRENAAALATAGKKAEAEGVKLQELSDKEAQEELRRIEKETEAEIKKIREKAALAEAKALAFIISKLDR
jgi:vacuolar-type H+-ATPase subunit H